MFTSLHSGAALALAVGTLMFQAPALAKTFNGVNPVSDQTLDHIRGGFSMGYDLGQMKLALDITQVNQINGVIEPAQQLTGASGGTLNVIQYGLNNAVSLSALNGIPSGSMGTVIQNSMSSQVINTISTLNITITSQAFAQAMNMQSSMQNAMLQFLH
ncbi:hypothetical protein H0A66_05350 [Alcaligenaceae bacterium]|nr:hypothetical protein [Alcaligenaceae bacterium]